MPFYQDEYYNIIKSIYECMYYVLCFNCRKSQPTTQYNVPAQAYVDPDLLHIYLRRNQFESSQLPSLFFINQGPNFRIIVLQGFISCPCCGTCRPGLTFKIINYIILNTQELDRELPRSYRHDRRCLFAHTLKNTNHK